MTKALPKEWMGPVPTHCDLCDVPIEDEFFDGAIKGPGAGRWATMCPSCFLVAGAGIGIGKGQQYRKDRESGKFVAIAGTTPSALVERKHATPAGAPGSALPDLTIGAVLNFKSKRGGAEP